jgi:hypothetical protein
MRYRFPSLPLPRPAGPKHVNSWRSKKPGDILRHVQSKLYENNMSFCTVLGTSKLQYPSVSILFRVGYLFIFCNCNRPTLTILCTAEIKNWQMDVLLINMWISPAYILSPIMPLVWELQPSSYGKVRNSSAFILHCRIEFADLILHRLFCMNALIYETSWNAASFPLKWLERSSQMSMTYMRNFITSIVLHFMTQGWWSQVP